MIQKYSQSGFSLVETLVAITILLIVIVGPMAISSSTARSTSFASDQVTAFFLAQEGLELAQKARDDFFLPYLVDDTETPWDDFTDTTSSGAYRRCYESNGCGLEILDTGDVGTPFTCGPAFATNCRLYIDTSPSSVRSRFTYDSVGGNKEETTFIRTIRFSLGANPYEVKVESEVRWRSGNTRNEQSLTVETYLLNTYAAN